MSTNTVSKSNDLPPSRKGKATAKHKTSLPGYKIPFNKFIYIFSVLLVAFICFNVYRILQWKTMAGGWSRLLLGRLGENPTTSRSSSNGANNNAARTSSVDAECPRMSVEDNIKALAEALGLPSRDLASAIAQAVREHLPLASLSSVSAAEATQSDDAVNILVGGDEDNTQSRLKNSIGLLSTFDDPAETGPGVLD